MTLEQNIAYDYHKTRLSKKEIATKYRISQQKVLDIQNLFDPMGLAKEQKKVVLKVNEKDAYLAQLVLERESIPFEIPEQFELTEYYNSKMNEL